MTRALVLLFAALALAFAAAAAAQPGDPVPQPLTPAEGAVVPANPGGIEVTYSCPPYRSSEADDQPSSDITGYFVRFARTADFADPLTEGARRAGPDCASTLSSSSPASSEAFQVTPGKVFWRAERTCFCPGGAESEGGPVRSFTIRVPKPTLTTRVQRRAYAGYAIEVGLRASADVRDGTDAVLERRVGSGWKAVGDPHEVSEGRASADVTLARGSRQLRWTVRRGDQVDSGAPATVRVVRPADWSTSRRDDGAYAGKPGVLRFRVARRGREIRDFKATVSSFCIGPTLPDNRFVTSFAPVPRARIAPDGRFLTKVTISKTDLVLRGRLRHRRVTGGRIDIAYSTCSGSRTFKAAHR